jgi:hypothetical protein
MRTSRYMPPRPDAVTRSSIIEPNPVRLLSPVTVARNTIWPFIDSVRNTGMAVWQQSLRPPTCVAPNGQTSGLGIHAIEQGYPVSGLGNVGVYAVAPGYGVAPGYSTPCKSASCMMGPLGIYSIQPGYGVKGGLGGVQLGLTDTTPPTAVADAVTKIADKFSQGQPATIAVNGKKMKVHANKALPPGFVGALVAAAKQLLAGNNVTVTSPTGSSSVCPPLPRTVTVRGTKGLQRVKVQQKAVETPPQAQAPAQSQAEQVREVSQDRSIVMITPSGPLPAQPTSTSDQYVETTVQAMPWIQQYGTAYRRQIYAETPSAYTTARAMIQKGFTPAPFARIANLSRLPIVTAADLSQQAMATVPSVADAQMTTARGYFKPFVRRWT